MAMYLVDTNVMLAASAIHELSLVAARAMPREIELREVVYEWLYQFDLSPDHLVLDEEGLVRDEYERNLPFNYREQEYGLMVLQHKVDQNQVDYVTVDVLEANGERIAVLEAQFAGLVTDREDFKWIACARSAHVLHCEMPTIVYAAETDWFIAEPNICPHGFLFQRLLPDEWYLSRI